VEPTLATRILILDIPLAERTLALGVMIDRVLRVDAYPLSRIEAAPDIGVHWRSDYIRGVVREEDGFVVIVDIACIFTSEDAAYLSPPAARVA
jgi:purine-binding chemotaxis protein CheW